MKLKKNDTRRRTDVSTSMSSSTETSPRTTPPISRKCSKTASKLIAIIAVIVVILATLITCSVRASASSYDWTTTPTSPYVYYPISGSIQYDNINYEFAIDEYLNRYGNVPQDRLIYDGSGAAGFPYAYQVESPVEGRVSFSYSAFSVPQANSVYPASLPFVTVIGAEPTTVHYVITYCFAEYSASNDSFSVSPFVNAYQLELPEFDIEEAYRRFLNGYEGESPVFPPDDRVCIVTGIGVEFEAIGDITLNFQYPEATDILESFSNIEIVPDVDVDAITEEAYQSGVQAGFHEGWEQGYNALGEFNPMRWVINIIQSIFDFKLIPIGEGITVGMVLSVLLVVPFAIWFLRLFAGG